MLKTQKSAQAKAAITGRERDYEDFLKRPPHLLNLSYLELEEKNCEIKKWRQEGITREEMREKFLPYLQDEKGIKAVTVFFSDLEGRLHALDYDKRHFTESEDNLTFDGSSIRGFTAQKESDLRLKIDWTSFRFAPPDLFGSGKILIFANVCGQDGNPYKGDFRYRLADLCANLKKEKGITVNAAPEIEGFLFKGANAEQDFDEKVGFELATMTGYFSSLPQDILRLFIDKFAEAQRALGFENEKDHPEVAPAQFELNFRYTIALDAADQIQLYKLLARQVARSMGLTASFLPKPIQNINGSGMHTNISLAREGKNLFFDKNRPHQFSEIAHRFAVSILAHGSDICLTLNPSVNAYRRLDPKFEAPNEIKMSAVDRGSMVRIPIGNEKSMRIEVRSVAPDANPYLTLFALIHAGMKGVEASPEAFQRMEDAVKSGGKKVLPGNIFTALELFRASAFMKDIMEEDNHRKYAELKNMAADRSPQDLGKKVKSGEILYHHEVTNQLLWSDF